MELRVSNDGEFWSSTFVVYKHADLVSKETKEAEEKLESELLFKSTLNSIVTIFVIILVIYFVYKFSTRKSEKIKKN
jgi:heme/copper-type cytochrome/quinol oxidase subunit 2